MRRLAVLGVLLLLVVVLAVAQLVLPGIAAQRLRDRLEKSGTVLSVHVHAFPAIELLWHQADSVVVRMGRYRSSPAPLGSTVAQSADVGSLDASAQELDTGLLTLRNATLRKRGDELTGTALVTESDLRTAVPILQSVQPIASSNGTLTLRGTGTVLGVSATVEATVAVRNGAVVVAPDLPFGGLATITVFQNPHVEVQSVGASSASPGAFSVSARALLR
jgi:hypothetical protein